MSVPVPIRLGVVEDHKLFREMLVALLEQDAGFEVVFATATVSEAKARIEARSVDVMLLDVALPDGNGIGLAVQLRRKHPTIGIVLLSDNNALDLMLSLPEEQRRGWSYLSKISTTDLEVVANTVRNAHKGMNVIDPALLRHHGDEPQGALRRLNERQRNILALVAGGHSNASISQSLGMPLSTVVNQLTWTYRALGLPEDANSRVAATLLYLRETGTVFGRADESA